MSQAIHLNHSQCATCGSPVKAGLQRCSSCSASMGPVAVSSVVRSTYLPILKRTGIVFASACIGCISLAVIVSRMKYVTLGDLGRELRGAGWTLILMGVITCGVFSLPYGRHRRVHLLQIIDGEIPDPEPIHWATMASGIATGLIYALGVSVMCHTANPYPGTLATGANAVVQKGFVLFSFGLVWTGAMASGMATMLLNMVVFWRPESNT